MPERWDMAVGQQWAYRARAFDTACSIERVELLQFAPKPHKVRIRRLDGEYAGLDEWVPRVRLRFSWDEREDWLRDERALDAAMDASEGVDDELWYRVADMVFSAYRPRTIFLNTPRANVLCVFHPEATANDLGVRLDFLLAQPNAFINRDGEFLAPAQFAEPLARLVIARHSDDVLAMIQHEEAEARDRSVRGWRTEHGEVSAARCTEYLRKVEPVFAKVREWCGSDAGSRFDELVALRAEVAYLTKLVLDAAERLKETGHPQVAARLRRAVEQRRLDEKPSDA
jgi:hypothetical protein